METGAGGSGLGLSICKAIVELHGGEIWAENRKPCGVVIHFTIPADSEAAKIVDSSQGDKDSE